MGNESHMAEVAAIFGKKLGESFEVVESCNMVRQKCMFTNQGLYVWDSDWQEYEFDNDEILHDLLVGSAWIYET